MRGDVVPATQRGRASGSISAQPVTRVFRHFALRARYPKLEVPKELLAVYATPPQSPDECVFARLTTTVSADLTTKISPCQFGGTPDCSNCGCMASAGMAAIARHRLSGLISVGAVLNGSIRIGEQVRRFSPARLA